MQDKAAVEGAAVALIEAFAANDRPRYFAAFTPEASFVFPIVGHVMRSRAEYEAEWQLWIDRDEFKVLECQSLEREITLHGEMAIFIHRVFTRASVKGEEIESHERETIVFRKVSGTWMAVHEHISPLTI